MKTIKIIYFIISLTMLMTAVDFPILSTIIYYGFILLNLYASVYLLNKLSHEQKRKV